MLKNLSFLDMLLCNLFLIGFWHFAIFLACIKLPQSTFTPTKERFEPKTWERGGRWYRDKLKVQFWKDKIPQYVGKDGFSKEHLKNISIEYIDEFVIETCRGEWMHLKNCICVVFTLFLNPLMMGLVFSFLILLGNLPFAIIQRYNRFRLLVLRKRLLRGTRTGELSQYIAYRPITKSILRGTRTGELGQTVAP